MAQSVDIEAGREDLPATAKEEIYLAPQWKLVWWKFRRHRMALVGLGGLGLFYTVAIFCEFFAPYDPNAFSPKYTYMPPQAIRFVGEDGFHFRPFVYGWRSEIDPASFAVVYTTVEEERYPVQLLVHGHPYKLLGLFETDIHLFGLGDDGGTLFLLGTDKLGRDVLSRMVYATRTSLSVGVVGVLLSFVFGVIIGGISGYYGGVSDAVIQRLIEFIRCIPTIPLWMSLSAVLPPTWPSVRVYFAVTIILSLIGWTGLARVVRGRFLVMREEEFVLAARLAGASEWRIIIRHMVPSFTSHIIASITLAFPHMIMGETSLSFLGIGLRPPTVSWGVMLKSAQKLNVVAQAPWLLSPVVLVVLSMLSFNFVGDGLRDAADPYSR